MNRLRRRLILVFFLATLAPLLATLWVGRKVLDRSLRYSSPAEVEQISRALEVTARQLYQRERDALRDQVAGGKLQPERFPEIERRLWPADVEQFWMGGQAERFALTGTDGDSVAMMVRARDGVMRYTRPVGVGLEAIRRQIAEARVRAEEAGSRDLLRAFVILAAAPWFAALVILIASVHRISNIAMQAYNRMAGELQQSRERLLFLTRLESWQALARKTAHEVKNSLTPIRLTMEELGARHAERDGFERQAAQIIVDEVNSLERRVRAFSEFAAEPPVRLREVDAAELLRERVGFLKSAHPDVLYDLRLHDRAGCVLADEDLLKAVLTNLLENAAEAAGPKGRVLARTAVEGERVAIEVHDSGPGLSPQARQSLFEPTISFKKGGMGLGLSIARKSAVLCGGDIVPVTGELGGAGFRVLLPAS